jgi:hypothetical protein
LSDFDPKKMINFLSEKWKGRDCPMCGQGPWSVQDKVFQLTEFNQGSMIIGGPVVPVIPVSCGNCGHTILVNALISEAISRGESKQEKKP